MPYRLPGRETRAPQDAGAQAAPPQGGFPIVAIGASAGGLEACRKLLDALPAVRGVAVILIQHLDPTHKSLIVELLADHTVMTVCQATDGMRLAPGHLYVIPPGLYLSVHDGALHLCAPDAPHGARMPFDFLLRALAQDAGSRAICVVLSGTGSDGTLGLAAIKAQGGQVLVQDPEEATHDGMPRSAIKTGLADAVLTADGIAAAIMARTAPQNATSDASEQHLAAIIALLRARTAHDFTAYKPGTLRRRVERRMAMAGLPPHGFDAYLRTLGEGGPELEALANDLLINVTRFFRDAKVFAQLRQTTIPDMIANHDSDQALRVWVVGCSTGEEAYSIAMLFHEALTAVRSNLKLEIFASDADADAVAIARDGHYPAAIELDIAPELLTRYFQRDKQGYRVIPELRASIVFTVQDILTDPPFSRLDMVSCRNLLIYFQPEAQAKVIAILHFALRNNGVLLLGRAETPGALDDRFAIIAKSDRLYRRIGRARATDLGFLFTSAPSAAPSPRQTQIGAPSRQAALSDLCKRLVMENYVRAAVLINANNECVFTSGATDRYLHVPPGAPTQNLLSLARPALRARLRAGILQANRDNARVILHGGAGKDTPGEAAFNIDIIPAMGLAEPLKLICFVDAPQDGQPASQAPAQEVTPTEAGQIAILERELISARQELEAAITNLEIANEEQSTAHEEALSIQQEYQSVNEELMTSKEELQSLNEELTALNGQLQETLDRQRIASNDLENVLYSTNVATVFLDPALKIRFFTPATRALFNLIPGDIGRPLADLTFFAADPDLLADVGAVLHGQTAIERDINSSGGNWYLRRILPYRTPQDGVQGVVILFADVTERHAASDALRAATHVAELANLAKSRFLAAASHDLRQPLQTLTLLQSLLASTVQGDKAKALVGKLDDMLNAMSGMLNTLLDINQIEAGSVHPVVTQFPINELLMQLRDQFAYLASEAGITLRVMPCSLTVRSDPRLLEQMIRNLLANALKYTKSGRVLLGCRRHGATLSIEVWDTGVGIPAAELGAIFEEYHQLDNPARERSRGLGLGLSIVRRLADLLHHRVHLRSRVGRGSFFAIDVALAAGIAAAPSLAAHPAALSGTMDAAAAKKPTILVIEDDPALHDTLKILLENAGFAVSSAASGIAAFDLVSHGKLRPDLILSDYNLPGGMDGLQITARLRDRLHLQVPSIILTGDISTMTLRDIERMGCVLLRKPVKTTELLSAIQRLLQAAPKKQLTGAPPHVTPTGAAAAPVVYVIDDDAEIRGMLRAVLEDCGHAVVDFDSSESFLAAPRAPGPACLLVDAYLPGIDGVDLLRRLREAEDTLPAIMITGNSDVTMAVEAMKAGAIDFIQKPIGRGDLLASIETALEHGRDSGLATASREAALQHLAGLSARQREVMDMVLAGHPSKNIAADLGISQRTVENHRAAIMHRTGAKSLPALARLAVTAAAFKRAGP